MMIEVGNPTMASPDNDTPTVPTGKPDETSPNQSDTAMAAAPSAAPNPSESTGDKVSKIPFRRQVEDWLKREKLPYIRVDEAKRALFAGVFTLALLKITEMPDLAALIPLDSTNTKRCCGARHDENSPAEWSHATKRHKYRHKRELPGTPRK